MFSKELVFDLFLPNIDSFGPWSTDNLKNGRPKVMFEALKPNIVLKGVNI